MDCKNTFLKIFSHVLTFRNEEGVNREEGVREKINMGRNFDITSKTSPSVNPKMPNTDLHRKSRLIVWG